MADKRLEKIALEIGEERDRVDMQISKGVSKKDLVKILTTRELFDIAIGNGQGRFHQGRFVLSLVAKDLSISDSIISLAIKNKWHSNYNYVLDMDALPSFLLSSGSYTDISILDKVAANMTGDAQVFAATHCGLEVLRTLRKSKDLKVRKIVYLRLGVVDCLDDMLEDKSKDIREEAVRFAPLGYEKLSEMTREISRDVLIKLIGKISIDHLPMLLGNRNMKNRYIAKMLESRLERGV